MEIIKEIIGEIVTVVIVFIPMILLYLLNILIFNKYPVFFGCFMGSPMYFNSLYEINSCRKVMDNLLGIEKRKLFTTDFINLALVFTMTLVFTFLVYLVLKQDDLGYPFAVTAIIFVLMVRFKIPKRFFN